MNSSSPYHSLQIVAAEIRKHVENCEWEAAAHTAAQMSQQLAAGKFPTARLDDRQAIEATLLDIAAITEKAGPLKEDIARLLKAFGPAIQSK